MKKYDHITKDSLFEDLGFNKAESINLKARSDLMIALRKYISENRLTQKQAGEKLGVDQPQISRLIAGKIGSFTIDKLMVMLTRAGVKVSIKIAA